MSDDKFDPETGWSEPDATRFSVAEGGVSTSPQPKNHARRPTIVTRVASSKARSLPTYRWCNSPSLSW
jgi:hypothetical protein